MFHKIDSKVAKIKKGGVSDFGELKDESPSW